MVPHGEVAVWRNDELAILNVLRHRELPFRGDITVVGRRDVREVIAVGIVRIKTGVQNIWLIEFLTIAINHAVAQMNAIARNSYDSFDDVKIRFSRRQKYDDIVAMNL